jgi:hypothetical protein
MKTKDKLLEKVLRELDRDVKKILRENPLPKICQAARRVRGRRLSHAGRR